MKETPRRIIRVTSSLNEKPTEQLGKRVWGALLLPPPPLSTAEPEFVKEPRNRFRQPM
jgi:hypothetical protein